MARVIAVPGLAVRAYVAPPVQHLRNHGYDATLLQPPAWRGVDQDLALYGRRLAADIDNDGAPVDVLIGLSAGSQAAAVAASLTSLVSRLVLVSPTVDPAYRSMIKQLYVFVRGDPHDNSAFYHHVPDWSRAGIPRIFRGFASAIALHLEDIMPRVRADITIIHTEYDPLTTHAYAAQLAEMGKVFDQLPRAEQPWSPLSVEEALRGLAATGLSVTR
jgi:hypothetical protein